ncbi:transposase [Oceanispirochaeta crateris]|uniref:Transposase n=1 Tax=Oceanispirochaeta crateris TaxID=2518645 RepID=A0A5C1QI60_9SPIO|nr:transposase [Oceanispirochaeta crateris]
MVKPFHKKEMGIKEIKHKLIQPGKPTQNAYIERFNRTVRHELLDLTNIQSIPHAQDFATKWLWTNNIYHPNKAFEYIPFRTKRSTA